MKVFLSGHYDTDGKFLSDAYLSGRWGGKKQILELCESIWQVSSRAEDGSYYPNCQNLMGGGKNDESVPCWRDERQSLTLLPKSDGGVILKKR